MAKKTLNRESLIKKALYKAWRIEHELCLYPSDPKCNSRAISAHSIQNNDTLADLSEGGHVCMIETKPMVGKDPILPDFERRGRNEATTFKGLCNPHDTKLFKPIDNNPLDLTDPEHIFLITYRSLLKEAYSSVRSGKIVETAYQDLRNDGVLPASSSLDEAAKSKPADDADELMIEKRNFDGRYLAEDYGSVTSETVTLPGRSPSLAVSGFFSAGVAGGRERWCALNVFPADGGHTLVFSYRPHNELVVREVFLNKLAQVRGQDRERLASKIILENVSNFVVRESLVRDYTPAQTKAIQNYFWGSTTLEQARFLETVQPGWGQELEQEVLRITGGIDEHDPRLNLFESVA